MQGVEVMHYWFPIPQKTAQGEKYDRLRKQGEMFTLHRTVLKVFSKNCDMPTAFDPTTKTLTMLLTGKGAKNNLYLSTEARELEKLKELEAADGKKRSHSAYMSALKPIILERLTARGLAYRDMLDACSSRIPQIYRASFELSITNIVDKYIIQPQ